MTIASFNPYGTATYTSDDLNFFLDLLGNYVIPNHLNELGVSPSTVGKVSLASGAAMLKFYMYENDAPIDLSISAAANNRIDRVVLRRNIGGNTVRAMVITGTAAANPNPPNLTTHDLPLFWIWVPSGFNPAADLILDTNIHDERNFRHLGVTTFEGSQENLMPNSEFIAFSGHAAGAVAPENWRVVGLPNSITSVAPLGPQPRGRGIRIVADTGSGIYTYIKLSPGKYTIKGTINVTSGSARVNVLGTGGVKYFFRTGVDQTFTYRYENTTTTSRTIQLLSNVGGAVFTVGQIMVTPGYDAGSFRNKHETIMLNTALTDASWTATAKSTGVTTIDLGTSFTGMLPTTAPIRGVILRLRANDSGSAAGEPFLYTLGTPASTDMLSILRLQGVANDKIVDVTGFAPATTWLGNQIVIGHTATGAGTLDATVEIIGIIT